MRAHTLDYLKRDGRSPGDVLSRGFWLFGVPRPLLMCRLFGHRPMVDGTNGFRDGDPGSRWVVCDRCGERPDPQGSLDPADWNLGDRYEGPWLLAVPDRYPDRANFLKALKHVKGGYSPGKWPAQNTGTLGGQLVVGGRWPRIGFGLKVGNTGSEHTLAADVHLPWIGSLYLHTERFGRGVVRRLNPVGYQSKVIRFEVSNGSLLWKLWADRDGGWSSKAPWRERVRNGSVGVDPRTILLGPKRYSYTDHGPRVVETVLMPHGDSYEVSLQLQRCSLGRKRGRKTLSWSVDWNAAGGIPTEQPNRGRIFGSGVTVTDASVAAGTWQIEAAVQIAKDMSALREREGWAASAAVAG
ncbi:hypothetical protein ABT336_24200 [Micromonospora sp. NPDC000207]|uniref:hypothetical protein n=1 Tax=Micromonospora sp. NPDC000207 TaxID=3154246 RepID=UPI00331F11D6